MWNRRQFMCAFGGAAGSSAIPALRDFGKKGQGLLFAQRAPRESGAYGSGHFGQWVEDQFGLPAYHYTCDQVTDPKAFTSVYPEW